MEDIVKVWLTSLKAKGKASSDSTTERMYLFWLNKFCDFVKMSAEDLFKDFSSKLRSGDFQEVRKVNIILDNFVVYLQEKKGYSRNSVAQAIAAIKSFFSHNGVPIKYIISGEESAEPRLPTPDEIASMYNAIDRVSKMHSDLIKAFIMIAKDSGLSADTIYRLEWDRPQSIGGERPYLSIREQLETGVNPIHIRIIRKKTSVKHDSFLGEESIRDLKVLYDSGRATGRIIPLRDDYVRNRLRKACRVAKIYSISPQLLRKFFITRMKLAPTLVNIAEKNTSLEHYLHGWDIIVEYMAEHSRPKVERRYFIPPPEILAQLYSLHYDAIRIFKI